MNGEHGGSLLQISRKYYNFDLQEKKEAVNTYETLLFKGIQILEY